MLCKCANFSRNGVAVIVEISKPVPSNLDDPTSIIQTCFPGPVFFFMNINKM